MFQSTRPMRGATNACGLQRGIIRVSIHAPHAGRDLIRTRYELPTHRFNPRAPCGARRAQVDKIPLGGGFNPRAPCGARHTVFTLSATMLCFNPRAPCGARRGAGEGRGHIHGFQSTRPVRGATSSCTPTRAV